jgi:isoamylase
LAELACRQFLPAPAIAAGEIIVGSLKARAPLDCFHLLFAEGIVMDAWRDEEGTPFPLGCTWLAAEGAYNFAILSTTATAIRLRLFAEGDLVNPIFALNLDPFSNKSENTWHCRVSAAAAGAAKYYALQADSDPSVTGAGTLFALATDLLDPYAREVFFPPNYLLGGPPGQAALAVLPARNPAVFDWGDAPWPLHGADLLVYELHVRGFTQNPNSGVPTERAGKYLGVIDKIPYLQQLSVTAVELMPVFCFDSGPEAGGSWGYMPISMFYPHPAYASAPEQAVDEFRQMVRALHEAGIEVILDVVFNHTAEGNQQGPTFGLKALDNPGYYLTAGTPPNSYRDYSGTGNSLDASSAVTRRLIQDALRYWVSEMHVDGFRFDLAAVLARNPDGSLDLTNPPIFAELAADPELADTRFIAEPWDARDGYLLGGDFPGLSWMQWNGRYRDDIRGFVRGDAGLVNSVITRVYGSDDLFPGDAANARQPWQSVNYIVSHDGYTLYDQVSYNGDGSQTSWNCGVEGAADVTADILALRRRQVRNFLTLLLMSNGTPMFRMGDEFLHTQDGNTNPYNIDNLSTWLDWSKASSNSDMLRFTRMLIAFRNSHPAICRSRFWRSDVSWYGPDGATDRSVLSRTFAYVSHGASVQDRDVYVMANMYWEDIAFTLQEPGPWNRVIDTGRVSPDDIGDPAPMPGPAVLVGARSVVVAMRA